MDKAITHSREGDVAKLVVEHRGHIEFVSALLMLNAKAMTHHGRSEEGVLLSLCAGRLMRMLFSAIRSDITEAQWHDDDVALSQADMSLHYHTLKDELLGIIEAREAEASDGT